MNIPQSTPQRKLYVLVRNDLPAPYRMVQGGHALAQFMLEHDSATEEWKNSYLIYLGVKNLKELLKWSEKLSWRSKPHSVFREPDLGFETTALACLDTGEVFSKLRLA